MEEQAKNTETAKPSKYDPSKAYSWEPGTQFLLTGEEFGVILNSLRAILNTPEAQRILLAERANQAVENSISRAVEIGLVVENPNIQQKK